MKEKLRILRTWKDCSIHEILKFIDKLTNNPYSEMPLDAFEFTPGKEVLKITHHKCNTLFAIDMNWTCHQSFLSKNTESISITYSLNGVNQLILMGCITYFNSLEFLEGAVDMKIDFSRVITGREQENRVEKKLTQQYESYTQKRLKRIRAAIAKNPDILEDDLIFEVYKDETISTKNMGGLRSAMRKTLRCNNIKLREPGVSKTTR